MVSGINNIDQIVPSTQVQVPQKILPNTSNDRTHNSFEIEDKAIISEQAKLLNSLEKFNAGEEDAVDLAMAGIMAKTAVSGIVRVVQAKIDMYDSLFKAID